ncbi:MULTISPECIES: TlpA family protein disulfide reductase [Sphingobacterium]|uniref:TlpA family protein disulfide reductase n=1 Tax=Sphingobacterium TaxID=28453 RepID=UPI002580A845|nr:MULTISPECIES: TlpA disulfide reductase family protein [Sphingobacterium]
MRNLSKRDFYAQLKTKFIRSALHHNLENKRFKSLVLVVCFVSMFSLLSQAQPAKTQAGARDIVPLEVGQKVPDEFWEKTHLFLSKGDSIGKSLSEFRNKTIVLDFWATWCGSCLKAFPEMVEFSNNNKKFIVIPVAYQNVDKIVQYLLGRGKEYREKFEFIVNDTILDGYFPHKYLPHIILIENQKIISNSITNYTIIESKLKNVSQDTILNMGCNQIKKPSL